MTVTTNTWQLRSHKGRSYDLLMFSKNDRYDQLFGIKTRRLWPNRAAPSQLLQWKLKVAYFPVSGRNCAIQIKICAEYRDMLPRPRLVCQEPGLRPIGRSPGVPDKSSRGLGSMSRYSAQILICFIAYIFLFLLLFPLWVWLGTVQDCHHAQCPLPLAIVIRMRLAIRQSKLPACLAEVQLAF